MLSARGCHQARQQHQDHECATHGTPPCRKGENCPPSIDDRDAVVQHRVLPEKNRVHYKTQCLLASASRGGYREISLLFRLHGRRSIRLFSQEELAMGPDVGSKVIGIAKTMLGSHYINGGYGATPNREDGCPCRPGGIKLITDSNRLDPN